MMVNLENIGYIEPIMAQNVLKEDMWIVDQFKSFYSMDELKTIGFNVVNKIINTSFKSWQDCIEWINEKPEKRFYKKGATNPVGHEFSDELTIESFKYEISDINTSLKGVGKYTTKAGEKIDCHPYIGNNPDLPVLYMIHLNLNAGGINNSHSKLVITPAEYNEIKKMLS